MSSTIRLDAVNVFTGDIQGGLGPFLATWLAQVGHTSPSRIGLVTTIVELGTLVLNGPAGALVDRMGRPQLLPSLACGAIMAGTLLLLFARGFLGVLAAQFLAASGGALVPAALTSLTLGIVKAAFPQQQGRNQAFNHGVVLTAALLISAGTGILLEETRAMSMPYPAQGSDGGEATASLQIGVEAAGEDGDHGQ